MRGVKGQNWVGKQKIIEKKHAKVRGGKDRLFHEREKGKRLRRKSKAFFFNAQPQESTF